MPSRFRGEWRFRGRSLSLGDAARVMGIVNVTPDSFSDGGLFVSPEAAIARGLELAGEGADVLDIGGESSRPGAEPVSAEEELRRVLPVIRGLRARSDIPISIDTCKAAVAAEAIAAGADIVNDIRALSDPDMTGVLAAGGAGIVLMHMKGEPGTMQRDPCYGDVVEEVSRHLAERADRLRATGVARDRIVLDPGIGFGKTPGHNIELLAGLDRLVALGYPVLVGVSRKSLLGHLSGRPVGERLAAGLAAGAYALAKGAHLLRVHDAKETCDLAKVWDRLRAGERRHVECD